jgi:cytochrome c biogenesis protein CcdA
MLALRRQYPGYRMARVNTLTSAGIVLQEEYSRAYGVPARDQGRIPAAFAGRRFFVGVPAITRGLPAYLGAGPLARPLPAAGKGRSLLARRFQGMGPLTVLLAGLLDSINPCAMATLIFFLSYLTVGGHRPRDLLWIGGLFTLGVFLTYFLIGLGLLQALRSLQSLPLLGRMLYPLAAVVTLTLATASWLDYGRARAGNTAGMTLQLPRGSKQRIHRVIRSRLGLRQLSLAAFATAVVVSALEFTCTSQVYLPTLIYVARIGPERLRATSLLLLYNVMFVLPLVALFTAASCGVSSRSMARFAARQTATIKLVMSLFFLGFTIYLFTVTVRQFALG